MNTSSSRTGVIHLDPGGYPELDKSGSMAWAGELGSGKALPLDTLIPTPSGWAQMGDLAPGDAVFDEQGRPTMVLWTSPVMTDHTCYEVAFSDGSMLVADAEHLWTTLPDRTRSRAAKQNFKARARGAVDLIDLTIYTADLTGLGWPSKGTTLSTEEIRATLHRGVQANHAIPVAGALALPVVALPIDPYVLGAWLGDGTSTAPYLTTGEAEILTFIEAAGYDISKLTDRVPPGSGPAATSRPSRLQPRTPHRHRTPAPRSLLPPSSPAPAMEKPSGSRSPEVEPSPA